jgi:eukaryotic-like serine/threonine-protein kinase
MERGTTVAERFEVLEQAGQGGMGAVYRCVDLKAQATVALKVLRLSGDSEASRFDREARILAELSHPNIVRYVEHGTTADGQYLVMEWVEGETLAQRVRRLGLDIVETIEMAKGLAGALQAMHEKGVVHRDIKPGNLIFPTEAPGSIKIIDFGVAKRPREVGPTQVGTLIGTPGYMAPEQAQGQKQLDGRVDLFALGCVIYLCLTGRSAFTGSDMHAVYAKILLTHPAPVRALNPDVSERLAALVDQLLRKRPAERPESPRAVTLILDSLHESRGTRRVAVIPGEFKGPKPETGPTQKVQGRAQGTPTVCLVLVGEQDASETETPPSLEAIRASAPNPSQVIALEDGWYLVSLSGTDVACQAADCALSIRARFPEAPIAIATQAAGSVSEEIIDRGTEIVLQEMIQSVFAEASGHPGPGAIRVDPATAAMLPAAYAVVHTPGGSYLVGASRPARR